MNISDKMGLYLLEKMDNDLESNKNQIKVKEEVIEKIGVYNAQLAEQIEEWKYKYFKLEEECCELKKKNKCLENDKVFHVNEIQKRNKEIKDLEIQKEDIAKKDDELLNEKNDEIIKLGVKILELENKLEVATAMVGLKNEVTPPPKQRGRKKGVVANGN